MLPFFPIFSVWKERLLLLLSQKAMLFFPLTEVYTLFYESTSASGNKSDFLFGFFFYISKTSLDLLLGSSGVSKSYYQFLMGKRRRKSWGTGPHAGAALFSSTRLLDRLAKMGHAMYIYVQCYYEQLKVMHVVCCQTLKLKVYPMKLGIIATVRLLVNKNKGNYICILNKYFL